MKNKNQRILTNRNFPDGKSWEAIEKTESGFVWVGEDWSMVTLETLEMENKYHYRIGGQMSFSFPVEEWFVIEKFTEMGRVYFTN